ncbi:hypothetical protein ES703_100131 [subsurface metagenome]
MKMKVIDRVRKALEQVIDPETGQSVVKMNMVKKLILEAGHCRIEFQPTSPVCPLAFKLSKEIVFAILAVEGAEGVSIKVLNHIHSNTIEQLFNS